MNRNLIMSCERVQAAGLHSVACFTELWDGIIILMITSKNTVPIHTLRSLLASRLAIIGAAAFILLLGLLHLLETQFDPSWRLISEYELGSYGWMMRLAFFSFALGSIGLFMVV